MLYKMESWQLKSYCFMFPSVNAALVVPQKLKNDGGIYQNKIEWRNTRDKGEQWVRSLHMSWVEWSGIINPAHLDMGHGGSFLCTSFSPHYCLEMRKPQSRTRATSPAPVVRVGKEGVAKALPECEQLTAAQQAGLALPCSR